MKICGTFRRDHGFSSFIDDQIVPHHALGKIAVKGCDLGCQRANHSRAIRGAAVPCGETLGVFSEDGGFRWCTTAAHNQARRLAWLAGSFGNSRRPRLPGGGLSAPNSVHGIVVAPCTTSLLSGRYARFRPFSFITSWSCGRCARLAAPLAFVSVLSTFGSWRIRLPGAEKGFSAPGGKKKQLPGAKKGLSAPGGKKKQLLGAERGHSAPGGKKKQLPGAERGHSALGGKKKLLPGAEKGHNAPGGKKIRLPGAEKRLCALGRKKIHLPGAEKGFSAPGRKKFQLPRAKRGLGALGGGESSRLGRWSGSGL